MRALFFLYAIHRFHLPLKPGIMARAAIPFPGYVNLLKRRFEEAIEIFLAAQASYGASGAISSALAEAYHGLGFQTLADQNEQAKSWEYRIALRKHLETNGLWPPPKGD